MDRRVRVPKDKEGIISKLLGSEDTGSSLFDQKSDVMTFAAVFGFHQRKREEFNEQGEGIRLSVFANQGQDQVIELLALAETQDAHCLADDEQAARERLLIFEEYANGGLELLRNELRAVDDPLDRLLLLMEQGRTVKATREEEVDLTKYII